MKRFFILLMIGLATSFCLAQSPFQIGSSSNGYSPYLSGAHCLSIEPGTGINGGSLSFVYRENTSLHTGTGSSSGKIRYSISVDGGTNWATELGTITPANTFLSRYPQGVLFNPDTTGADTADLKLALLTPNLNATPAFEGHLMGLVDSVATVNFSVPQEEYLYRAPNAENRIPRSLVERVKGEYFYVCFANNVRDVNVYRGRYTPGLSKIVWALHTTINPVYSVGTQQPQGLQCAFDPTGMTGFISFVGDLAGGGDSVYSPIFIKTTNGGVTWGAPEQIQLKDFGSMRDSLRVSLVSTGIPTLGSSYPAGSNVIPNCTDLTVDALGHPHFVALVGNALSIQPNYGMSDDKYMVVDFTQDINGSYIGKYVSSKITRRGIIGTAGVASAFLNLETWMQVTRTQDGTKIFYSWTETDTKASGWTPTLDNNAPNLLGRGYNVTTGLMTPIVNWTIADSIWSGRVLTPIVANSAIEKAGSNYVPTVAMRFQTNTTSALMPVSYWYFPNINYPNNTFTDTTVCFLTCGSTPLAATYQVMDEICDNGNGMITATVTSTGTNPGPYTYNWTNGQTSQTISNLLAGSYEVTITDNNGCQKTDTLSINNSPGAILDSTQVMQTSCDGSLDGSASVFISGGMGPYHYAWITGDTTSSISGIPAGGYFLQITDGNGCIIDTTISVGSPPVISILSNATTPSCFGGNNGTAGAVVGGGTPGYTYFWSNGDTASTAAGLSSGTYNLTVTDLNGCTQSAMVMVNNPPDILLSTTSIDVSCNGGINGSATLSIMGGQSPFTYSWSNGFVTPNLVNVPAGTYYITITDANSCMKTDSVTILQPDPITSSVLIAGVSCNGDSDGSAMLTIMGGNPPFTYSWTNGATSQDISGVMGGTYAVTYTDSRGCSGSAVAVISEPTVLRANVFTTPDNGSGNGSAASNTTGGTPPYTYSWNGGQTTSSLSNIFAGNYLLTVTDANGCSVLDTIVVSSNVGIDELQNAGINSLELFPNPVKETLHIQLGLTRAERVDISVFDLNGKVYSEEIFSPAFDHALQMKMGRYASGVYLLKIKTETGEIYKRIIVE